MQDVRGIGDCLQYIVRNHDDGNSHFPVDALHQPVHGFRHLGIQSRNRLVQYQHFIRSAQGPGQQYPLLLPAGKIPVAGPGQRYNFQLFHGIFRNLFFLTVVKGPQAASPLTARKDHFPHGSGKIPLHKSLLGQVPDFVLLETAAKCNLAGQWFLQPQQRAQQRTFACTVLAYDTKVIPFFYGKRQPVHQNAGAIS